MKKWRLWIGILVSLLCLYLAARGIVWNNLLGALGQVRYVGLLPALGLLVLAMIARAYRWRLTFELEYQPRIIRLFHLLNIGYLANAVTPMRLGDLLRAYLCAELEGLKVVRVLSTIVLERIADTLAIVVLLALLIPWVSLPREVLQPALWVGLVSLAAGGLLLLVVLRRSRALMLFDRMALRVRLLQREGVRQSIGVAVDGLATLRSWRNATGVAAWSLAIWLCTAVQFYVVMWAMGLHLPPTAALLVVCLTSLGMVVPSSPGYVGVFEYLCVVSLSLFGVAREIALGYALVVHALAYLAPILLGGMAIWAEGYSYVQLRTLLARGKTQDLSA
ncbi:MAG: flippase-like domain-containing protein [Chloroflexi bacterium]|nr:flippase-like domain-containing protein [Chloroflexota bacterium]